MPTPTTMEERFDETFTTTEVAYEENGAIEVDNTGNKLKAFTRSEINLAVAEERKKIVEIIREYAEPYDGAIWLNEVNAQKIINLITTK